MDFDNKYEKERKKIYLHYLFEKIKLIKDNKYKLRANQYIKSLNCEKIDLDNLKSLTFYGIPENLNDFRPILWFVLLGYLPLEKLKWNESLENNKNRYYEYIKDYIINPWKKNYENGYKSNDKYNIDEKLWDQCEKDTKRTRQNIKLFTSINERNGPLIPTSLNKYKFFIKIYNI